MNEPKTDPVNSVRRISKDKYYLNIAKAVSQRSTCIRRQYGAVIVKNDEIIATGYNGSARGEINCCDVGTCWREENNIPHGQQYEKCVAVHAEQNALISAPRDKLIGATIYIYGEENGKTIKATPCEICNRMLINAGVTKVVWSEEEEEETCQDANSFLKDVAEIVQEKGDAYSWVTMIFNAHEPGCCSIEVSNDRLPFDMKRYRVNINAFANTIYGKIDHLAQREILVGLKRTTQK